MPVTFVMFEYMHFSILMQVDALMYGGCQSSNMMT